MLRVRARLRVPGADGPPGAIVRSDYQMPPMSKVKTFIDALKTGETTTTKKLERVTGKRSSAAALELIGALRKKNALDRPLDGVILEVLRSEGVTRRHIERCIDAWPDKHKEDARRAIIGAINAGKPVRFRWGLKSGAGCDAQISKRGPVVTITALSPRSTLRISKGEIFVDPDPENPPPRRRRR
jgi:hypothetical protein